MFDSISTFGLSSPNERIAAVPTKAIHYIGISPRSEVHAEDVWVRTIWLHSCR